MSVEMWNCHFWPLPASYIYICIVVDPAIKLICCLQDQGGVSQPLSLNDNFEQWRDHSVACQCRWGVYLSLSANDNNEQWRHHSVLCQIYGGYIGRFTWCHTDISLYLPISWDVTLTFPDIFLLVDCFAWALIDCIEKQRVHSELWQFQMGGYIIRFTWCHTDISLYLPISWLFWMGSHWPHWKVKSSLWALAVLNGEGGEGRGGYIIRFTWCYTDISLYLPISWLFRMGSHWLHWKAKSSLWALAVSNGEGGEGRRDNCQFYPSKSENLSSLAILCFASQKVFSYYIWKT